MEDTSKIVNAFIPTITMAYGMIVFIPDDRLYYSVQITTSAMGAFTGEIKCQALSSPGSEENYRVGDRVVVQMSAAFDLKQGCIESISHDMPKFIVGLYRMPSSAPDILHTTDTLPENATKFLGSKRRAGMVVGDDGTVTHTTDGLVRSVMMPGGNGIFEECKRDEAMNFQRVVAGLDPIYPARDHFGMSNGPTDEEQALATPGKTPIVNRRFVPGNDGMTKFVSVSEGSKAPFCGANLSEVDFEDSDEDVANSKCIQSGPVRLTTETGKPGEKFHMIRVDKVVSNEMQVGGVVTPAVLGNLAHIAIGDDGSFDIRTGGLGTPVANSHTSSVSFDKDGNMVVYSNGKITLSHSESDVGTNSIVIDPDNGIDIKADKGFRVNGKYLVNENFLDFFDANSTNLCLVTAIGGPAPLHPKTMTEFKAKMPLKATGFKTDGVGAVPLIKKIIDFISAGFSSI